MSTYIFDSFGGGSGSSNGGNSWQWPIVKSNTIFNIVPQGHKYVVERFGKLHSIQDSGWFLAIPVVDKISYVIDVRERALDIPPQAAITRDNVSVEVSGNLFIRFQDPEKAAYGALNPLYSVTQHAQSAMRSAIGEMELDEILHGAADLTIKGILQEASEPWGLEIRRYEITEVSPDQQIRSAMDKQAAAERARREQVLRAEGGKRRTELESEGVRISLANESEGNLIKVRNEAEATKTKILLEAQGQSEAIRLLAKAQAEALMAIAQELQKPGGEDAARLALARDYVAMYGEMGKQSNTILFNDRPADVSSLMAQAMTAMKAVSAEPKASPVPQIEAATKKLLSRISRDETTRRFQYGARHKAVRIGRYRYWDYIDLTSFSTMVSIYRTNFIQSRLLCYFCSYR
jgi:regulator of protease activity HflC (stomatin/prohibitin superfamily)